MDAVLMYMWHAAAYLPSDIYYVLKWMYAIRSFHISAIYGDKEHICAIASCRPQMGPMLTPWTLLSWYKYALATHIHKTLYAQYCLSTSKYYLYHIIQYYSSSQSKHSNTYGCRGCPFDTQMFLLVHQIYQTWVGVVLLCSMWFKLRWLYNDPCQIDITKK